MSSSSSAVKVCVRLRPLNRREKRGNTIPVVTANTEKGEITVVKGLSTKATRHAFNFDNVFSEFATQEEVFESTLLPIVGQVMKGYEATVFAYGQTGTGKTYTMEGDISADGKGCYSQKLRVYFRAIRKQWKIQQIQGHCVVLGNLQRGT